MKRILRIYLQNKKYDLNLQLIHDLHIKYIEQLNQQSYHANLTMELDDSISAREITDFLFEDDHYILKWIREQVEWRNMINLVVFTEQQWQNCRMKIINPQPADNIE